MFERDSRIAHVTYKLNSGLHLGEKKTNGRTAFKK